MSLLNRSHPFKGIWKVSLARGAKHVVLWGILAFSFLPLWVMLNISQKDNTRFYSSPFGVEIPFRSTQPGTGWELALGAACDPVGTGQSALLIVAGLALIGSLILSQRPSGPRGLLWLLVMGIGLWPFLSNLGALSLSFPWLRSGNFSASLLGFGFSLTRPLTTLSPSAATNWANAWGIVSTYIANTAVVAISATTLTLLFALAGAYFFARVRVPLSGFLWFALVFLLMFPAIANLVPLFVLLRRLSLLNTLWALVFVGCSVGQAFAVFVIRGYIQGIPHELFEAAEVDGASHFWQFRSIVLPLSGPIVATVAIFRFIAEWNDFILPLVVLRDQHMWTITVGLMRLNGEYVKQWGTMMAGYAISSLPIVVLFLLTMRLFIRGLTEGAVKG